MRCPACKPSTEVSKVWLKSVSLRPLRKSWRGRLLTRQMPKMQIRTSPGRMGLCSTLARGPFYFGPVYFGPLYFGQVYFFTLAQSKFGHHDLNPNP